MIAAESLVRPGVSPRPRGTALLAKAFRPFFLAAALQAALAVPLFLLQLGGYLPATTYVAPLFWHAHEMLFGFTAAVFAGFLLTAITNWTSRSTAEGPLLGALVILWLGGRLCMSFPETLPHYVPAVVDSAFLPALAVVCTRPIVAAKSARNYGFVGLLGILSAANIAFHASALGHASPALQHLANLVALDVVAIGLVVMTGRVVPMFTRNALGATDLHSAPLLERLTAAGAVAAAVAEASGVNERVTGAVFLVTGLFAAARMRAWRSSRTLRAPLLWILHAGSAWIALGFVLRGAAAFSLSPFQSGVHALTAGAVGALTLGMMTRVGLGHTGRMLAVPVRTGVAFGLVLAAGALRVVAPIAWPGALLPLAVAGVAWSAAFATYLVTYGPILVAARVDGKSG